MSILRNFTDEASGRSWSCNFDDDEVLMSFATTCMLAKACLWVESVNSPSELTVFHGDLQPPFEDGGVKEGQTVALNVEAWRLLLTIIRPSPAEYDEEGVVVEVGSDGGGDLLSSEGVVGLGKYGRRLLFVPSCLVSSLSISSSLPTLDPASSDYMVMEVMVDKIKKEKKKKQLDPIQEEERYMEDEEEGDVQNVSQSERESISRSSFGGTSKEKAKYLSTSQPGAGILANAMGLHLEGRNVEVDVEEDNDEEAMEVENSSQDDVIRNGVPTTEHSNQHLVIQEGVDIDRPLSDHSTSSSSNSSSQHHHQNQHERRLSNQQQFIQQQQQQKMMMMDPSPYQLHPSQQQFMDQGQFQNSSPHLMSSVSYDTSSVTSSSTTQQPHWGSHSHLQGHESILSLQHGLVGIQSGMLEANSKVIIRK